MIKLAYCNVENLDLKKASTSLSDSRRAKIDFYRFSRDKKLSAGAYMLLKKMLNERGSDDFELKIGKYGKPYILNNNDIHFNLSHSKNTVLCAISDMEVGVDIEYIDHTIDLNIAKNYFFRSEYESVISSQNPHDEFFKYWVLKESYMKYTGLGMNLKLDSFEIIIEDEIKVKNNENLKLNLFDLKNYKIGITSHYNVSDLNIYDVNDLYQ